MYESELSLTWPRLTGVPRVMAADVPSHAGERVVVQGWVHRLRALKAVTFLVVRDASGLVQIVAPSGANSPELAALVEETVVTVTGRAVANAQAPGGVEIVEPVLRVLSGRVAQAPFDLYRPELAAALPTQLDHAAVALRHPSRQRVFRAAAAAVAGFRNTLDRLGFVEVHTPKIVGSVTEGGANVFALDYFGRPAYLAQSPQFYKQTMVGVFERVYEIGPVFRAEPHDTARHLAEYVSLDVEMGFIEDHHDVIRLLGQVLAGMLATIDERVPSLAAAIGGLPVVPAELPTVHFADAQALIMDDTGADLSGEPDLAPSDERWLGEWALREHGSDFIAVTGYPMRKRPFYTHPERPARGAAPERSAARDQSNGPERPEYSNSFDLLFRGLELVTGGQRLHRYEDYLAALAARAETPEPYEGYLEAFRHGMPPHGGFALGLERFLARLVGAANVREATLFPRDLHRLAP